MVRGKTMIKLVVVLWAIAYCIGVVAEFKQAGMIIAVVSTAILVSFNPEGHHGK